MSYLSFLPLATFAITALSVAIICAVIGLAERRRARAHGTRRRTGFQPRIIQGGKADVAVTPRAAAPEVSAAEPASELRKVKLSILP